MTIVVTFLGFRFASVNIMKIMSTKKSDTIVHNLIFWCQKAFRAIVMLVTILDVWCKSVTNIKQFLWPFLTSTAM